MIHTKKQKEENKYDKNKK